MEKVKQFTVINEETRTILYSGNNAFKAVQASFSSGDTKVNFSGEITRAVFSQIVALQERLN